MLSLAPMGGGPQARGERRPAVMLPVWVLQHLQAKHSESDHFSALWVSASLPRARDSHLSDFPAALATLSSPSLLYSPFSTQQHRVPLNTPPCQPSSCPHLWQQPATLHNPASRDLCPELPSTKPLCHPSSMQGSVPPSGLPSSPDISMAGRSHFFHSGSSRRARL